jgi:hypothetical protein
MDRRGVQFDATDPTGTVEVAFQAGEAHYAIVGIRGATPTDKDFYRRLLDA